MAGMLLVVTGASGVGKSTVRRTVAEALEIESCEIRTLATDPPVRDRRRRQEVGEDVVSQATELATSGKHLLFCGDPFPAGEVLACPSADKVDIAICLLDANADVQLARLAARGDEPEAVYKHHVAFAAWQRRHAIDPTWETHVVTEDCWPPMQWDRWVGRTDLAGTWTIPIIDTSMLNPSEVAVQVLSWASGVLAGTEPFFTRGWHLRDTPVPRRVRSQQ